MTKSKLGPKLQAWVDARRRHKLSHAQIQMARELGMTPKSLRKLASGGQQQWKAPLRVYIEDLYFKRFGRERPLKVESIEAATAARKARASEKKRLRREAKLAEPAGTSQD